MSKLNRPPKTATLTKAHEELLSKLSSKLWRLDNLYTIRDKNGAKRILKLNYSQRRTLTKFSHSKKIILKSRQQGISTLFLAYNLDSVLFQDGYSAGIQSYGQDESDKLSKRAELMWEEFPEDIKKLLAIKLVSNNSKGMTFSNGSNLKIGNFRGDTLQSLHVSELGKIAKKYPEKARELKTGAFQAVGQNNKITIESTAEGRTGLFYEMWRKAEALEVLERPLGPFDFQAIFLSWVDDPDCTISTERAITPKDESYFSKLEELLDITLTDEQKWWYVAKQEELGDDIKQEYPSYPEEAFYQSLEGTYYAEEFKALKVASELYDQNLPVYSAFDLGMNDDFVILFFQVWEGEVRIVDEYHNSGKGLEYYRDVFSKLSELNGYSYAQTYVPHDISVTELISGKTRWDALIQLGFKPVLVKKHKVQDGIQATRAMLKGVKIDEKCTNLVNAIQNYRKKRDEKYGVYLDSPLHDEHSHYADALRYLAMGMKYRPMGRKKKTVSRLAYSI